MSRVYVGNLPYDARMKDIDKFFRGYGRINDILMKRGYCFVEFDDRRDAEDAVYDLDGERMLGVRVSVEMAKSRPYRERYRSPVYDRYSRRSYTRSRSRSGRYRSRSRSYERRSDRRSRSRSTSRSPKRYERDSRSRTRSPSRSHTPRSERRSSSPAKSYRSRSRSYSRTPRRSESPVDRSRSVSRGRSESRSRSRSPY
uniref:RRM domain-containing protein n=1 Tax=Bursaphelenchus xylophilus TaxID=6326 RepID=A0A1I7SD52_BURXY